MLRREFGEAHAGKVRADVALDRGLISDEGPRADSRTDNVLQPAAQKFGHSLTFVRNQRALLRGPKRILHGTSNRPPSAAVDGFASAFSILPAKINTAHPSTVGPLNDAALSPATPATHFDLLHSALSFVLLDRDRCFTLGC